MVGTLFPWEDVMTANDYLKFIVEQIHSTVVATIDKSGLPVTCVIDMMYADEDGLYFLTAKGKDFYQRLKDNGYIALSGIKGESTMNCTALSIRRKVTQMHTFCFPPPLYQAPQNDVHNRTLLTLNCHVPSTITVLLLVNTTIPGFAPDGFLTYFTFV